jgi:hypothetical protein
MAFDAREAVVDAIARELARRCGGNAVLNRLEAAAHLDRMLDGFGTSDWDHRSTAGCGWDEHATRGRAER